MLTIFSTPKAFRGHFDIIQRNAIGSWIRLLPAPQVILFGDSEGTAETAEEFGVEYVKSIETNEFGTPLLRSMIENAERLARHDRLCFVNADILLTEGFERAIREMPQRMKDFLLVGKRVNLDLDKPICFDANWREWLATQCRERGTAGDHTGIDFFVFPKRSYTKIPDLTIGRAWVDQWLIKNALQRGAAVVDITAFQPIVHQNHDYTHVAGGQEFAYKGMEAKRNLGFCDGEHVHTLLECTYEMAPGSGPRRVRGRRLQHEIRKGLWDIFVRRTAGVRRALGLRRKFAQQDEASPKGYAR